MNEGIQSWPIKEEEKKRYLTSVNSALELTVKEFERQKEEYPESVKKFGDAHNWDWGRLPKHHQLYTKLTQLVEEVRQQYLWFAWIDSSEDPTLNCGHFKEINISAISGLPWSFDFMELRRLKSDAKNTLKKLPSYESAQTKFLNLLFQDNVELSQVPDRKNEIYDSAMDRSFYEKLQKAELLGWDARTGAKTIVNKRIGLGIESLWNITHIGYSLATSMFHAYVIDAWLDSSDPLITEEGGVAKISPSLRSGLKFGGQNDAWYILQSLDQNYTGLHPVHVSRALIGPYENKYHTDTKRTGQLPITGKILGEDPSAGLFRVSVQYAYAPMHEEAGSEYRQIVYREKWSDEIIVTQTRHASTVSKSVLGTNVKVLEM